MHPLLLPVSGPTIRFRAVLTVLALTAACRAAPDRAETGTGAVLPTGVALDPAGRMTDLGPLPLSMIMSPDGGSLVALLCGWREQGVQVIDRATGTVRQTLTQPSAFLGLAFAPDGKTLYASGGGADRVYRYDWTGSRATLRDSIVLGPGPGAGQRYVSGLAVSPDGGRLYVALNLADSLAVVDPETGRELQRLPTGRYPYAVVTGPDGTVYVSAWGGEAINVFPAAAGRLTRAADLPGGRHPSALLLNREGSRLFAVSATTNLITVLDTRGGTVAATLTDPPPAGPNEGTTPNALALSVDGRHLYAAEADANAVAVFALSAASAGVPEARGNDSLMGRIPVGWYPSAVLAAADTLLVVNGKGTRAGPNPGGPQPGKRSAERTDYTLGQISGTLTRLRFDPADLNALGDYSRRVAHANGWDREPSPPAGYPPFEHVLYIIKENRTYDQIFGDLPIGDGDSALVFFPREVTPNHHALAERFGLFDRFFVNAEVSADGHNWSTAAYATDYVEKTVQSNYSSGGRDYDYEGENRGVIAEDDVNEPANGYLWDLAERAGISLRNYGEFVVDRKQPDGSVRYVATKPWLALHTDPDAPGWDLDILDQRRVDAWLEEFRAFELADSLPRLEILRLPNDHTSGTAAGAPTPRAMMADNDLALGRVVEAVSKSPFWKNTVIFVLEDDAQNGPDHVDSHRSPLLVISAYNDAGVVHRFANTTDVIATIAEILHLGSLSQFDYYGRPLREIWSAAPDLRPYESITPGVRLDERNPAKTALARQSEGLRLAREDRSDDDLFNRILWRAIKGDTPYPGIRRMSMQELHRGR